MGMRALCTLIVAMSGARTQENIDLHQKPANVRALRKSAHPEPTTYAIFANGVRQRVDTISHEAELEGSHNQVGDILLGEVCFARGRCRRSSLRNVHWQGVEPSASSHRPNFDWVWDTPPVFCDNVANAASATFYSLSPLSSTVVVAAVADKRTDKPTC